ncbi:MAG TPA: PadR family transcriptional regulator [Ktedonobacteraceae bacterium]
MHKILLLLGMLLDGSLYGYQLHQIVRAHGELYADLKKANLYYLLERLTKDGALTVEVESGAKGARGERLIYTITEQGRSRFYQLLRETLLRYEPVHTGIETAVVFLTHLSVEEGIALLKERQQIVQAKHAQVRADIGQPDKQAPLVAIASDHILSFIDAELAWLARSLERLQQTGQVSPAPAESSLHVRKGVCLAESSPASVESLEE